MQGVSEFGRFAVLGLLALCTCDGVAQPHAGSSTQSENALAPDPAVQCFNDGTHEICLQDEQAPEHMLVFVDGLPIPATGSWKTARPRVPQVQLRLEGAQGPQLATGPNGALRIACPGGMRQYFKSHRSRVSELPPTQQDPSTGRPRGTCERLGLALAAPKRG